MTSTTATRKRSPKKRPVQASLFGQRGTCIAEPLPVKQEMKSAEAFPGCGFTEAEIRDALEVIQKEQMASVSLLQRRMRLSYSRASRIMDELERRKVVGPASGGSEPREIFGMAAVVLLLCLCASVVSSAWADTMELSRKDARTWSIVVTPAASLTITNFTTLQGSTNGSNWFALTQVRRENAVRFYEVTNAPQMFFRLQNSPVAKR